MSVIVTTRIIIITAPCGVCGICRGDYAKSLVVQRVSFKTSGTAKDTFLESVAGG